MARYIDADYLDTLLTQLVKEGRYITRNDYKIIDNILFEFPTADVVERKRGKWKLNKDGNWACPFCEFDPYHDNMKGMNYCPNCGARLNMPLADCGRRMEESDDAEIH